MKESGVTVTDHCSRDGEESEVVVVVGVVGVAVVVVVVVVSVWHTERSVIGRKRTETAIGETEGKGTWWVSTGTTEKKAKATKKGKTEKRKKGPHERVRVREETVPRAGGWRRGRRGEREREKAKS